VQARLRKDALVLVKFCLLHPWSLAPERGKVEIEAAKERERLYRENFHYLRAARQAEFCPSWVLGQRIGWRILSPVDVTLSPLEQTEVSADDMETSARAVGKQEVWLRDGTMLAMDRPPWLHQYQFREGDGWASMFVPNGQGTVEWRLGWVPEGYESHSIMVFPGEESQDLGVRVGVLTPASLARMSTTGFSIAVGPRAKVDISRGQEIARMVLVGPESLKDA
jgi:hypothetical protein